MVQQKIPLLDKKAQSAILMINNPVFQRLLYNDEKPKPSFEVTKCIINCIVGGAWYLIEEV